jgi:adenylate kinase
MADDEDEVSEPKRKVFIQAVSGYVGGNLAKRFATEGFEVLGTLKAPSDPKPLAVTTVVEPSEEGLRNAFLECELTVLDCLGDVEAAEKMLSAIAMAEPIETPKVLVGVSSIMTWARTSPNSDEPEAALTEAEYKRRRPHSSYKELVALEKLVTKSKREGLRTHVVAAGLTYGAEEDLFHPLFKAAWSCQPLPLLSIGDGSNVRASRSPYNTRRPRHPSHTSPRVPFG